MKLIYFAILFFACAGISLAQTNAGTNGVEAILALVTTNQPAPVPAKKPPAGPGPAEGPIVINAQGPSVLDMKNHCVTYCDKVSVANGQWKLTCEWLKTDLPQSGEVTNIVAQTNVVFDFTDEKGEKTRGTGDQAVYFFHVENGVTNKTITLTGTPENPPTIQMGQNGAWRTTNFVYDCLSKKLMSSGPITGTYTNTAAGTNQPAEPKLF